MANTLNNFNLAVIADEAIEYFSSHFFPVGAFARNFSDEIAEKGESVKTRIPGSMSASDLSSGYDSASQDVSTTAVDVTLSAFKGHVTQFSDVEVTKAKSASWLAQQFYEPSLEATMKDFMDTALALVVAANYSNATVSTAANFDTDDLADISGTLSTRKVPKANRSCIIMPDYHAALSKDIRVADKSAFGDDLAIVEGRVQRARGFDVHEYDAIPNNGENLKGMCLHPSALAMAARPVTDPTLVMGSAPLAVENRIETRTGLPFQFRVWYSPNAGQYRMSCGFLYGVSKAQGDALQRITAS